MKHKIALTAALLISLVTFAGCSASAANDIALTPSTPPASATPAPQSTAPQSAAPQATPSADVPASATTNAGQPANPAPASQQQEPVAPAAAPSDTVSAGIAANGGSNSQYIGEASAKSIALNNAGLAEADVQFVRVRLDYDDGRAEYDVEFIKGNEEYDYEIDAISGAILSMDKDAEYYQPATSQPANPQYIGEQAAQNAALAHAGLDAASVNFVHTKLERDDGVWKYEVEFYKDNTEYDYDVDAVTGAILSYDSDAEYYAPAPNPPADNGGQASISADQAKQTALSHAGVAEADTSRMQVKLDHDDGRLVYEVEWNVGRTEYSYDIDAASGTVLSHSVEQDD